MGSNDYGYAIHEDISLPFDDKAAAVIPYIEILSNCTKHRASWTKKIRIKMVR